MYKKFKYIIKKNDFLRWRGEHIGKLDRFAVVGTLCKKNTYVICTPAVQLYLRTVFSYGWNEKRKKCMLQCLNILYNLCSTELYTVIFTRNRSTTTVNIQFVISNTHSYGNRAKSHALRQCVRHNDRRHSVIN